MNGRYLLAAVMLVAICIAALALIIQLREVQG